MSDTVKLSEATFQEEVLDADLPVLVAFTAAGCAPCRRMTPVVEGTAALTIGRARVGKVDVAEDAGLAARFDVQAVPTFLVFRAGRPVARLVGVQSGEALLRAVKEQM